MDGPALRLVTDRCIEKLTFQISRPTLAKKDCLNCGGCRRRLIARLRPSPVRLHKRGGDVTVVHLPDVGLKGNTHFPFSDLNNLQVADLMSAWLTRKGLDKDPKGK